MSLAFPPVDSDPGLTANSDARIPTQRAVKSYVDTNASVTAVSETPPDILRDGQNWYKPSTGELFVSVSDVWQPAGSAAAGVSDVGDLTTAGLSAGYMLRVANGGGLEARSPAQVRGDIGAQEAISSYSFVSGLAGYPSSFPPSAHNHDLLYDALGTASSAVSAHASLTTGVHGLAITAGQTLTVTTGGTLGSAAYTAASAYAPASTVSFPGFGTDHTHAAYGDHTHSGTYDPAGTASGAVSAHAALTSGVHGLNITAGQTLTVTTGGTLGSAAFTDAAAYDPAGAAASVTLSSLGAASSSKFIAGAGALTGPSAPLTIGTAAASAVGDFATSSDGALARSAVQPASLASAHVALADSASSLSFGTGVQAVGFSLVGGTATFSLGSAAQAALLAALNTLPSVMSDVAPTSPTVGMEWWNTNDGLTYKWYGSAWVVGATPAPAWDDITGKPGNLLPVRRQAYYPGESGNPSLDYCGVAPEGSAESAAIWTITRLTISTTGSVTATGTATNVKWTDRLTATYT